jgi:hypothetical protein
MSVMAWLVEARQRSGMCHPSVVCPTRSLGYVRLGRYDGRGSEVPCRSKRLGTPGASVGVDESEMSTVLQYGRQHRARGRLGLGLLDRCSAASRSTFRLLKVRSTPVILRHRIQIKTSLRWRSRVHTDPYGRHHSCRTTLTGPVT